MPKLLKEKPMTNRLTKPQILTDEQMGVIYQKVNAKYSDAGEILHEYHKALLEAQHRETLKMVKKLLLDPDWKHVCEDNEDACAGCKHFWQALNQLAGEK